MTKEQPRGDQRRRSLLRSGLRPPLRKDLANETIKPNNNPKSSYLTWARNWRGGSSTNTAGGIARRQWLVIPSGTVPQTPKAGHDLVRDECFKTNWFIDLPDANRLLKERVYSYNNLRGHGSLGRKTPTEYAREFRTHWPSSSADGQWSLNSLKLK